MKKLTWEVGRTVDGMKLVRNQFIYPNPENVMAQAHREFTREERKKAKKEYKDGR